MAVLDCARAYGPSMYPQTGCNDEWQKGSYSIEVNTKACSQSLESPSSCEDGVYLSIVGRR